MLSLVTEITRAVHDSSFSIDELFYRYFSQMPILFCQSGSSDLYHNSAVSSTSDEDDDDIKENPHKGPEDLEKAIQGFIDFMKTKDINVPVVSSDDITFVRYSSFPNNTFKTFVVFRKHQTIVSIHVTPSTRETLTSISVIGGVQNNVWDATTTYCKTFIQPPREHQDEINIIGMSNNEFYLSSIPLKNKNLKQFSYNYYNEDFEKVSERILKSLQTNNESGLILLHGSAGTGKTSYLKHLLHTITHKKLIYLPPDLLQHLSAPSFITFMISQASNSILLIEDAENVLLHREAGGNQAVSNILNISDGILGDVLRLQIVCTFNSDISTIDKALLRPGRLIALHHFQPLTKNRTENLMKTLYGDNVKYETQSMTLAEIFNFENPPDHNQPQPPRIGFV